MSSILADNLTWKERTPQSHRCRAKPRDFLRPAEGRCTRPCANAKLRLSEAAGVPAHPSLCHPPGSSKSYCFFSLVPTGRHMKQAWTQNKYFLLKVSEVLRLSVATAKTNTSVNFMALCTLFNLSVPQFLHL